MQPVNRSLGYLCALAATVIWSGNFIAARTLGVSLSPVMTSFLRWSVALLCLLPFGWNVMRKEMPAIKANWRYFLLAGITGVSIFNTLIYTAGRTTEVMNMALIASSSPVWIIILSRIFLGEAVPVRRGIGVCIALMGTVLLITRGDLSSLASLKFAIGDLWMLAAALVFSGYSVLLRKKPAGVSSVGSLTVTFAIGVVSLIPAAIWDAAHGGIISITPMVVGGILYIGIGASLVSYLCWTKAIETIGPTQSAMVYYSLPVFSATEAYLLLGEPVTFAQLASGLLILGGILFATRN